MPQLEHRKLVDFNETAIWGGATLSLSSTRRRGGERDDVDLQCRTRRCDHVARAALTWPVRGRGFFKANARHDSSRAGRAPAPGVLPSLTCDFLKMFVPTVVFSPSEQRGE